MVIYYFMEIWNKDNIKMDRRELSCDDVDYIYLAHYTDQLRSALNMMMSLPYEAGECLHCLSDC
jgi:hypothetical protein